MTALPANTTYGNNSPVWGPNSQVEYHTEPQRAPARVHHATNVDYLDCMPR
jgi:hypothetical protein